MGNSCLHLVCCNACSLLNNWALAVFKGYSLLRPASSPRPTFNPHIFCCTVCSMLLVHSGQRLIHLLQMWFVLLGSGLMHCAVVFYFMLWVILDESSFWIFTILPTHFLIHLTRCSKSFLSASVHSMLEAPVPYLCNISVFPLSPTSLVTFRIKIIFG